jgi:signal recognition particle subunit SRP54
MFEQLSDRLRSTMKRVRGQARLTEENISEALREVRIALLEADVALAVAKDFIKQVRQRAIGEDVAASLSPGQQLIKIVNQELVTMMGEANDALDLSQRPPAVVMMAGLQGAGKTTTVAKLAKRLMEKEGKKVMVVSADVYRPAAIEQLKILSESVGCQFHPSEPSQSPVEIVTGALQAARNNVVDVLMVDTAGRLHVDAELMSEIQQLHKAVDPVETLFVADSMTGQDAINSAKAFGEALPLTGIVLTKTDGDARGGAALSIRQVTGKPIKFLGIGEKLDGLEPFHPDRVASRILGMGDVLTLIEEAEDKVDVNKADQLARKLKSGKGFDLDDYSEQIQQMNNMGGLDNLMQKLPGMDRIPQQMMGGMGGELNKNIAIISSMTAKEKSFPAILKGSRKRRIAMGSGTQVQDVNRLLKQFTQMQKMMKKMGKKGGMAKMMRAMGGGNKMPPGMPL